jgi:nucleoside-diphosphate-sugar epimerase
MKILLTGGAGDLATVLTPALEARGDTPLRLDIVPTKDARGVALSGSILDRPGLRCVMEGVDSVVHIAWHGVHDAMKQRDALRAGGTLRLIAVITQESVMTRILRHLQLASAPAPIAPSRVCQEIWAFT